MSGVKYVANRQLKIGSSDGKSKIIVESGKSVTAESFPGFKAEEVKTYLSDLLDKGYIGEVGGDDGEPVDVSPPSSENEGGKTDSKNQDNKNQDNKNNKTS